MASEDSWIKLLLDDASIEELDEHRRAHPGSEAGAHAALRLRAQLDQRRQRGIELTALNDIAVRLTTVRDNRVLLQEVVDQARRLLGVPACHSAPRRRVLACEARGGRIACRVEKSPTKTKRPAGRSLLGRRRTPPHAAGRH